MKKILIAVAFLSIASFASAENVKTRFNPFTNKLDYITSLDGITTYPGFILTDSSSNTWSVTVLTTGALYTQIVTTIEPGFIRRTSFVLQDDLGNYWTVTINTFGNLITTSGGSFFSSIDRMVLNDSSGIAWVLGVMSGGNLITS